MKINDEKYNVGDIVVLYQHNWANANISEYPWIIVDILDTSTMKSPFSMSPYYYVLMNLKTRETTTRPPYLFKKINE